MYALRAGFLFLEGPDLSLWHFLRYTVALHGDLDIHVDAVDKYHLASFMASGMYAVFYFTWSRSFGHMAVGAHIVDARTGRRMRAWQKAVRSALQVANGYLEFLRILDIVSIFIVLIDRERRRSIYDMAARTVVVIGEPTEEEPETARESGWLDGLLGRLTRRDSTG